VAAAHPPSAQPAALAGIQAGTRVGHYAIIERLGAGGMGEVLAAEDLRLNRRVALKLLSPTYTSNEHWLKRFRREAQAASALNHPNILTIYEVGECDGIHFISTEFIDGQTLRQTMSGPPLELPVALSLATQIANALAAAHAAQVVHRDIKPENVMIRSDRLVKVVDFGVAKQLEPVFGSAADLSQSTPGPARFLTEPGLLVGTVRYMSPEQARGIDVDTRSDIFSFGVVLYEMLCGHRPFDGKTAGDAVAALLERETPSLAAFRPDIPPEVERIVHKCLRKDRDERYQSAKDLYLDLKQLLREVERRPQRSGFAGNETGQTEPVAQASLFEPPQVHYTRSGDVNIAYQIIGQGAIDLVFVMGWVSHLEWFWKEPSFSRFLRRLAAFCRVILFDKRGTGLSDRVPVEQLPTLEQRMDDVRAVMDAAGVERAVLCGVSEGGPMCSLFAATYPEKTTALVMIGSYARRMWAEDYPWGPTEQQREAFFSEIRRDWGGPVGIEARAPSRATDSDFRNWWGTYLRMGASPGAALALTRMNAQIDIRPILPTIRVPTLVIHRRDDRCLLVEEGRYLAEYIPGAKFAELPGKDHLPFVGDQDAILDEIEEFLTGVRHAPQVDRVLATVLYLETGEADPGAQPSQIPSGRAAVQHAHAVREIELFKGRLAAEKTNSVLAWFDGPARAIRAALAISESARRLGLPARLGLHTGECDLVGHRVSGAAVDLAQQLVQHAGPYEVLVSSTVKDLVAGAGINFKPVGEGSAAGLFAEWRVYSVER
jgi:serine/threonine protein kinase/alpha-beta hydrolase superfamily lysophospholipase